MRNVKIGKHKTKQKKTKLEYQFNLSVITVLFYAQKCAMPTDILLT